MGPCRLTHDLLDQLRGDHVGDIAASLLAEVGEREQAVGAARHQRAGRGRGVARLEPLVGPPDVGDTGAVGRRRRTRPQAGIDQPGQRPLGRARAEVRLQRTPGPDKAPGQPHPDGRDHIGGRQRLGHCRRLGRRPPVPPVLPAMAAAGSPGTAARQCARPRRRAAGRPAGRGSGAATSGRRHGRPRRRRRPAAAGRWTAATPPTACGSAAPAPPPGPPRRPRPPPRPPAARAGVRRPAPASW